MRCPPPLLLKHLRNLCSVPTQVWTSDQLTQIEMCGVPPPPNYQTSYHLVVSPAQLVSPSVALLAELVLHIYNAEDCWLIPIISNNWFMQLLLHNLVNLLLQTLYPIILLLYLLILCDYNQYKQWYYKTTTNSCELCENSCSRQSNLKRHRVW